MFFKLSFIDVFIQKETNEEEKAEASVDKTTSGGILPGSNDVNPHTSVKVHNPPGGKSSITF